MTTSHDCQSSSEGGVIVNTTPDALLVAEVTRESRLQEIEKIGDHRINKIRELAEVSMFKFFQIISIFRMNSYVQSEVQLTKLDIIPFVF